MLPGLAEHLRQGIFATPKTYTVIARLSTTSGALRSDQVRGVRGLGLKVLEVDGDRLIEDGETTQDFVFVTEPRFPFKDALEYSKEGMRTAKLLSYVPDIGVMGVSLILRGAQRVLRLFGGDLPFKYSLFAKRNTLTLGETFYTAAPLQYGKLRGQAQCLAVVGFGDGVDGQEGGPWPRRAHRRGGQLLQEQHRRVPRVGAAVHRHDDNADRERHHGLVD